eukprot:6782422-Pyramimonas_sp.AAC.1
MEILSAADTGISSPPTALPHRACQLHPRARPCINPVSDRWGSSGMRARALHRWWCQNPLCEIHLCVFLAPRSRRSANFASVCVARRARHVDASRNASTTRSQ